jgi:hypothetical protein
MYNTEAKKKTNKRKFKGKYEPRPLTYEEHKQIDEFLRYFHGEGKIVFDLLRQGFGDYSHPVRDMARAVNHITRITGFAENKKCFDRPVPMEYDSEEFEKWSMLYYRIGCWTTEDWEKMKL